jgi:3-oxoacyl-[acyl-carrier protein] reductase
VKKLQDRVAIVSGSGRGIGQAIALVLAKEGAKVVVNDLDEAPAAETVSLIKEAGGEAIICVGSVTDPEFAQRFVDTAVKNYGDLHIIVNNAGYTWDAVIQNMSEEQFDAIMDVHLKAPWRILKAAADVIRSKSKEEAERGEEVFRKVVNISSVAGSRGNPGQTNYSSAKSAVIGLAKTLAKEWGRYKVNANAVAFGYIKTRLTEATDEKKEIDVDGQKIGVGIPTAMAARLDSAIPLGRGGTPEEAAGAVLLLCLPESNYVSGQLLEVTGGE